ncbi:sulfatase [Isoptericola sp. BMS4]|uniref:sulfatase family protein n=1 Tax=Isoptericola sp. BMS4 TaxID=2527875 RepID=UPI0014208FA3|nr:sulfatase-like hydrolase/transferase [Isoptericola sp. BMS4]
MTTPRPNVLLVLSDDHGYADRGALGHDPAVRTPALDRLAAEGVSCTDAYVAAPICNPSRNALISGAYPARWGSTWFGDTRFDEDRTTLAERFRDLGYTTGYFGKVHYGPEEPGDRACPPEHGFDESYYGLAGRQQGRLHYTTHTRRAVDEYGPEGSWRMAVQPMFHNGEEVELEGFLTAELGRRAREFVDGADRPFFAMVAFNAVHNFCWQLPADELERRGLPTHADWDEPGGQAYADWYDGAISPHLEHGREYYLAQLELMDAEVGRLLDLLDATGRAEETIVVYLTDNGGSTCNYGSNAPLSGTKYTLAEGGVRVPFLVRWPGGGWSGGTTRDGLVSSMDLYPTLLAAAGYDVSALTDIDGVDQSALWRGETAAGHEALHWECGYSTAVREGDLKLRVTHGDHPDAVGVRTVEHVDPGDGVELHDLRSDVGEHVDLAAERPDDVRRLWARHEAWLHEVGRADLAERHGRRVAEVVAPGTS